MSQPDAVHQHKCYTCGIAITCVCSDRRDVDRMTGKERKLECDECAAMKELLTEFYKHTPDVVRKICNCANCQAEKRLRLVQA